MNPTPGVRFAYDPYFRRRVSMTGGEGTTTYEYQPAGSPGALKLAKVSGPSPNATIAWQYDALGRTIGRTVGSSAESFTYDTLGRVASHASDLGAFDIAWLGQTTQITGRTLRGGTVETDWTYDTNTNDRRLTAIANSGAARGYRYTTTPQNIIAQIVETAAADSVWPAQTWNYSHDDADRLLQGVSSGGAQYTYGYDAAGNILSGQTSAGGMSASYDALNQVASVNDRSFVYDANGNLTDDGQRTYTWDAENRLLSVSSKAQPARTTNFRYDGVGRRIATVSPDGVETRYLWCGQALCQARDASDTVTRRYFAEGELTAAGGMIYARDHLGSVRDVLSSVNGSRVASYDYDPYGNPTQSDGQAATDFRYAGMFYHQESGLYLTRFRAYDPATGRWLSRDPVGQLGGVNLYAYAEPDPVSYRDPAGNGAFATLVDKGASWAGEQAGETIAERGFENTLGQFLPEDEAKFIAAGSVDLLKAIYESKGEILECPECMLAVFLAGGALPFIEDAAENLLSAWRKFKSGQNCPNIVPISPLSAWYLNPTYQDDTPFMADDITLSPVGEPSLDDGTVTSDSPFVVYLLGPFGASLRFTFAVGGHR